jgi:hypothetical protein
VLKNIYSCTETGICPLQAGTFEQRRTVASHSRLSKTLEEVLADKGAVGYFIQFLEARGGFSLIKFWLDVESFRTAAGDRNCRKAPDEVKLCPSNCEPDKCSLSTDSGSVFESPLHSSGSTNDISVRRVCTGISDEQEALKHTLPLFQSPNISLTYSESPENLQPSVVPNSRLSSDSELSCSDNYNYIFADQKSSTLSKGKSDLCSVESAVAFDCHEKVVGASKNESDVYSGCAVCGDELVSEQTSTNSSKDQTTTSLLVGCSQLTQAIVDDALRIFNTYISHEATHPVKVPDDARDRVVAAICSDVGMVDADCFTELQTFVFQTMEKE